jgi:hypothetical protein
VGECIRRDFGIRTTWALGKIANRYFESGRPQDVGQLRKEMRTMEKAGKEAYPEQKARVDAKREESRMKLNAPSVQRTAGEISQGEYEKQVAPLAS